MFLVLASAVIFKTAALRELNFKSTFLHGILLWNASFVIIGLVAL